MDARSFRADIGRHAFRFCALARRALALCAVAYAMLSPTAQAVTLTISPKPTGGNVTSNVGGINCGSVGASCSANITAGTSVTLTATPDAGYTYVNAVVNGSSTTANPATFPMPATAITVSVNFKGTAPTITSASSATFTILSSNTFTVTGTGPPAPTFSITAGSLPGGVTLASDGTLSGTPANGTLGTYPVTITATNGVTPAATQAFTLTVTGTAPAFTSAAATTFTALSAGTFAVTATGNPPPSFSVTSGALPSGVTLASNGTLSGTPGIAVVGSYPVTITASNGVTPNASQSFTLTVAPTVPGAPTAVAAAAGSRQASVSFTAPASNGGASITSYTATSTPGGFTATGASSPLVVSGLSDLVSYTFNVTATNSAGTGPQSAASNAVTPQTSVGAPTNVVASISGPLSIGVTCDPPAETGDSPIISYTVTATPGNATATGPTCDLSVTALTRGTSYTLTVTATNSQGTGPASAASNSVTAATTPSAPTGVSATPGLGSASVAFTGPFDDGGSPITGYVVVPTPNDGGGSGVTSPIDVMGLQYGGTYTFQVYATNAAGNGALSLASNSIVLPLGPTADPPPQARAMGGDGQATVSFDAATSSGAPITSYVVTATPGGQTGTGPSSPIDVPGLTNGTSYTFHVASVNVAGTGIPTPESNPVTPRAIVQQTAPYAYIPNFNDNLVAVIDTGTNTVIATVRVGAGPVAVAVNSIAKRVYVTNQTDATVSVIDTDTNTVAFTTTFTGTPAPTPFGIAVSPDGTQAYIALSDNTVAVTNAVGVVQATIPLSGTITGSIIANSADGSIDLATSDGIVRIDPATNTVAGTVAVGFTPNLLALGPDGTMFISDAAGTGRIVGFKAGSVTSTATLSSPATAMAVNPVSGKVYATQNAANSIALVDGSTVVATWPVDLAPLGISVEPSGGHVYVVSSGMDDVSVLDAASGSSVATIIVGGSPTAFGPFIGPKVISVPGAPTNIVPLSGNGSASVAFGPPAFDGNSPVTGYQVTCDATMDVFVGTTSPIAMAGLTNGTTYNCFLSAVNAIGIGLAYGPFQVLPVSGKTAQTITFNNPGARPFSTAPFGLTATATSGLTVTFLSETPSVCTVSGSTVTMVSAGTCIIDADQAGNGLFYAAPRVQRSFAISASVPAAPVIGSATPGDATATIAFSAPGDNGGSAITGYTVTCSPGAHVATGTSSPILVSGMPNGTTYSCSVTATNSAGTGPASAGVSVTPMTAAADVSSFNLTAAPSFQGVGAQITVTSATIADGTYTLNYSLSGANSASALTAPLVFSAGSGSFHTPVLANAGTTSMTATGIAAPGAFSAIPAGNTLSIVTNAAHGHTEVVHTSGAAAYDGVVVNVASAGVTGGQPLCGIAGPYSIVSTGGSYTFTFSPPVGSVRIPIALGGAVDIGTPINDAMLGGALDNACGAGTATAGAGRLNGPGTNTILVPGPVSTLTITSDAGYASFGLFIAPFNLSQVTTGTSSSVGGVTTTVSSNTGATSASARCGNAAAPYSVDASGGQRTFSFSPGVFGVNVPLAFAAGAAAGTAHFAVNGTPVAVDAAAVTGLDASGIFAPDSCFDGQAADVVAGDVVNTGDAAGGATANVRLTTGGVINTLSVSSAAADAFVHGLFIPTNAVALQFSTPGTQTFAVLSSSGANSLATLLSATDTNIGLQATWSVVSPPSHGTLNGFPFNAATTGSTLAPAVSYTPASGFTGSDGFAIQVTDSFNTMTMIVNVTVQAPALPTLATTAATNVGVSGATLHGTASSNGSATTASFDYGTTIAYGSNVAAAESPLSSSAVSSPVSAIVSGLACGTLYHYRLVGVNAGGSADGGDATFTTAACPVGGVAPSITSANQVTFTVQAAGTFTVTASGSPAPALSVSGALPSGVTFTPGTGLLAGTPGAGTAGTYPLTISASNGILPNASQAFTLTISGASNALSITKPGAGTGTVTSSPSGISCGATCSALFAQGASVSLTATPSGGSTFAGWGGACSGNAGCSVTMDAGKAVSATFDPPATAQSAEMQVTQSAVPNPGKAGKDIVFTLVATNHGPASASNVVVTDAYPAGTSFIWASAGCANASNTVTCAIGALGAGASAARTVVLRPASPGSLTNTATVSATESDPSSPDNLVSATITVNATPAGAPVLRYRLYSPVTLEHHFTTDLNEYTVLGTYIGVWNQEGTVGHVFDNPGSFSGVAATPYYRLYNTTTRWHHWTTDANEYYTLIQFPNWNGEGVDGYILPTNAAGSTQLYRLLYPFVAGLHHWTIDANEYNTLISTYGWIGEGGSGYVIP